MTTLFSDTTGALFSPCRQYRYRLWRRWQPELPSLVFLMLNPSTADEVHVDPTVRGCIARAKKLGYGGLEVLNLFAWRSTDPKALREVADPVGVDNDGHIVAVCETAMECEGQIICGWGKHGALHGRGAAVRRMLDERQIDTYALEINQDGSPRHPLYIAMDREPVHISPWAQEAA